MITITTTDLKTGKSTLKCMGNEEIKKDYKGAPELKQLFLNPDFVTMEVVYTETKVKWEKVN